MGCGIVYVLHHIANMANNLQFELACWLPVTSFIAFTFVKYRSSV
jgi:hypothetical protein